VHADLPPCDRAALPAWEARRTVATGAVHGAQGLLPIFIHPQTALPASQDYRLGGNGDSYYEYLLKVGARNALCTGAKHAVRRRVDGNEGQLYAPCSGSLPQGT